MKEKLTMPCTEQQWEQEIKPRIEKIQGMNIYYIQDFNRYDYLVNNLCGNFGFIANQRKSAVDCQARVLIPYDPDRFCASLGEGKWMPLTRGGIRVKEVIKFGERLAVWGINEVTKNGSYWFCGLDGLTNGCNNDLDLIPYNHEIEAIKKEIAIKEKELEQLKGKLK